MDLAPKFDTIGRDDQSWLGSARGTSSAQTGALVMSTLTPGTHYPNGYIPSGLKVGKFTSGPNAGNYGLQVDGASDGTQTLAGFVFTATAAPRSGAAVVNFALLDTGRVVVAKLPVPLSTTAQATNPRFVYA